MLRGYLMAFLCRKQSFLDRNLHEKMHGLGGMLELFVSLGAASIKRFIYHSIFGGKSFIILLILSETLVKVTAEHLAVKELAEVTQTRSWLPSLQSFQSRSALLTG